jgi:hypothetical protein
VGQVRQSDEGVVAPQFGHPHRVVPQFVGALGERGTVDGRGVRHEEAAIHTPTCVRRSDKTDPRPGGVVAIRDHHARRYWIGGWTASWSSSSPAAWVAK